MSKKIETDYNAEQIQVLEGLEAVRKRPGMYIGSTSSRGLHHLVWEIVDNSIDEHLAGFGKVITVTIHKDHSISVSDNGRGIPTDKHKTGLPAAEVILTVLHAGGKFGGEGSGYKVAGGLHGVGSSVVNALSIEMTATIRRDGKIHEISFSKGNTTKPLSVIGTCDKNDTGTTIWFKPDPTIFKESTEYDFKTIHNRMRESAFLNPGLHIVVEDQRQLVAAEEDGVTEETFVRSDFNFENGIKDYVSYINRVKTPLHEQIFYAKGGKDDVTVEVALQYAEDSYSKDGIYSYANNIKTPEGGTHETGFKTALTQTIKEYIVTNELMKKDAELPAGEDMRVGITAIVSVKVPEAEFEGQTKSKLGNSEVRSIVDQFVCTTLTRFFDEHPDDAKLIVEKVVDSFEERMAARKAKENRRNKKAEDKYSIQKAKKLADCEAKTKPEDAELYIVEGNSAGGSAKQGRDSLFQAILPLRGKVLNVEKAKEERIMGNVEINEMIKTLKTNIGEDFNIAKLRYHKVVFMTDADVDGSHIQILLLTFFYRYMRPLIESGHVYLAKPPLFKVTVNKKKMDYFYTEEDKDKYLASLPANASPVVQRYKGLGEMNPEQLWETTMDPSTRILERITIEDAAEAEILFTMLMGDDPELRKDYINENSSKVTELDF